MKQLFQSTFSLLCLLVLTVLTVVNTCQIDNLEDNLIKTRKAVDDLGRNGVAVRGGGEATRATAVTASAEEAAALADPKNLLKPNPRPFVDDAKVARGGTLRNNWYEDPPGMNLYTSQNAANMAELGTYMSNTIGFRTKDNPDVFAPDLALKVTTPDNGQSFEVTLRKGVWWHEPVVDWQSGRFDWLKGDHEVTSDDFIFVFDMLKNQQVTGRVSSLRNFFELESYEALDRYRFRVKWKERLFTNLSSLMDLWPSPRWLFMYDQDGKKFDEATWGLKLNEHWYNQKMLGTGPYKFVEWVLGVRIVMERNRRYFGEAPAFDRVVTSIFKDQNATPRRLKAGDLDYTYLLPEQYRTEVMEAKGPVLNQPRIKQARYPDLGFFFIAWSAESPFFGDKRVRQAMTMALDRQRILDNVFYKLGRISTGPFPSQNPCYDASIKPWPFDLKAAGKLLDEAGWTDTDGDGIRDKVVKGTRRPFSFSMLVYGGSNEYETLANIYRESLLQIGVRLNPRPLEWATLLKKMDEKEFDAYTSGWVMDWDIDLMQIWHSKEADRPNSSNRIGFRNKEADRIAEALRREFDHKKRVALCHEFHALIHEEQPYTFIYERDRAVLYWDHMNELEFRLVYPYRDLRYFSFSQPRP
jgi:ABC-type transport system substrate-binding protein